MAFSPPGVGRGIAVQDGAPGNPACQGMIRLICQLPGVRASATQRTRSNTSDDVLTAILVTEAIMDPKKVTLRDNRMCEYSNRAGSSRSDIQEGEVDGTYINMIVKIARTLFVLFWASEMPFFPSIGASFAILRGVPNRTTFR